MRNEIQINKTKGLLLILAIISLSLTACETKNDYPDDARGRFMNSCQKSTNNNQKLCSCVLEKIQYKYSFDEYSEMNEKVKAEEIPQEYLFFLGDAKGMCARE